MPNEILIPLQSLVSCLLDPPLPPQTGERQWVQLRDSGEATLWYVPKALLGFPGGLDGKASARNAGDLGSIPGLEGSPGEGDGNPLQYLAWKIPWTEKHGRLQSMGLQRVGHD